MFESLSDRLQETLGKLAKKGQLNETDVDNAMKEVRRALLEADVNFRVVKDFVARVRERAIGQDVLKSLSPYQTVIGIVNEELISVLGNEREPLRTPSRPPQVIMLVGLQGSGKTTHAAKLASHLRKEGRNPILVAGDVYRPAAVNQLQSLGKQINIPVFDEGVQANPVDIAAHGVQHAIERGFSPVIVDTAGRLQVDERMMQELVNVKARINPTEILLVADAMTGQEAVGVAEEFHRQLGVTGLILTKMDGDARGGAALSIRAVTGVPIKFIGTGEKVDALEPFYPDRLATRILGMGDVQTLMERAKEQTSEEEAERLSKRMMKGSFDLSDFLDQLQKIKKMGPIGDLLKMIPGMGNQLRQVQDQISDDTTKPVEAMIQSMTPYERRHPESISSSRRRRIARGSGTTSAEVNQLLSQFKEMRRMMEQMGSAAKKGRMPKGFPPLR